MDELHDCTGCARAGQDRRDFLLEAARTVAGIALLLGGAPGVARALPWRFATGVRRAPHELAFPVPAADGATVDRDNEVILVRYAGAIYAFALSCPHQNTALRWEPDQGRFQCPKHHSKYGPDGHFIEGRATRGMDRFAIRRDGARVVVDLDHVYQQDTNAAEWAAAQVKAT